jgi:hypothetical protein
MRYGYRVAADNADDDDDDDGKSVKPGAGHTIDDGLSIRDRALKIVKVLLHDIWHNSA